MPFGSQASANTTDPGAMQKSEEFLHAFMMGFELVDAIALLRVDDLYVGKQTLCSSFKKLTIISLGGVT